MNAPPAPEHAVRLEARAAEYVRLAGETAEPAVKRDRLGQASQARIASGRMLEAIAAAIPGAAVRLLRYPDGSFGCRVPVDGVIRAAVPNLAARDGLADQALRP